MARLRMAVLGSTAVGLVWIGSFIVVRHAGVVARDVWWPLVVMTLLVVVNVTANLKLRFHPCPRCSDAFCRFRLAFSKERRGPWKCENCGLPFGAERDPDGGGA